MEFLSMKTQTKTQTPIELLNKLDKLETELRGIKLLLDRQFINPFVRMNEWEVEKVKWEFR